MSKKNQHVISVGKGWAVKKEGSNKYTTFTDTKAKAIHIAREIAKNNKADLIIHGRDGKIQDKDSYVKDSCLPKDKKH
jgi:hypothetical protein